MNTSKQSKPENTKHQQLRCLAAPDSHLGGRRPEPRAKEFPGAGPQSASWNFSERHRGCTHHHPAAAGRPRPPLAPLKGNKWFST